MLMNQIFKRAVSKVSALSDEAQEEIAQKMLDLAETKRIDALLRASEERGGETPHHVVVAELRSRYAS
jgi:uncharacterized ferredoxin-like protein